MSIKALWFALTLSFYGVIAHAQTCPPPIEPLGAGAGATDRGMLWRIERGGVTSYLSGSLHIGRPAWAHPGPALRKAWIATEVLALELAPDEHTMAAMQSVPPPRPPLEPALTARLTTQVRVACLPEQALAALHPMLQLTTLTALDARWLGLDSRFSHEALLMGMAAAGHRRIVGLETMEEQLKALIPSDPAELRRNLDEGLSQLEQGQVRKFIQELAQAWARGDLERLSAYEQWCECVASEDDRRLMQRLIEGRNPTLAARISALHAQGRPVLAAVGALHMTGPKALPLLLKDLGFKVERVVY